MRLGFDAHHRRAAHRRAAQDRSTLSPAEQLETMRDLSLAYHGPWDDIRQTLTDPSTVNYT